MKKCLVIGNGRAGQRHVALARACGLQAVTVDPYQPADLTDWRTALSTSDWDYVVIASPPNVHLEQLRECVKLSIPTLCEKPLSDCWQDYSDLPDTAAVLIAYNWLYNASVSRVALEQAGAHEYHMFCEQARELPEWGLLLDHVSHDFSILDYISGGICKIANATYIQNSDYQDWTIFGTTKTGRFALTERVWHPDSGVKRVAIVNKTQLVADTAMFSAMWKAFLAGNYQPGLYKGKQIQGWLQDVAKNWSVKNGSIPG